MEDRIPTNLRTLLILEVLGTSDRALSPTEINQSIGLPKQTIHRLCAKLEQEGFLARGEDGKKLRPTRRSRLMASGLLYASRFHIARHQVMQRVADEVGETVNFVVPDSEGMIYVDRVEADWPFRVQLPVGHPCAVSLHGQRQNLSGQPGPQGPPSDGAQLAAQGINAQHAAHGRCAFD